VAGVACSIEKERPRHSLDGSRQLVDDVDPTPLAEVGDRLDELRHATSVSPTSFRPGRYPSGNAYDIVAQDQCDWSPKPKISLGR